MQVVSDQELDGPSESRGDQAGSTSNKSANQVARDRNDSDQIPWDGNWVLADGTKKARTQKGVGIRQVPIYR
ncbi:hypothetical protein TPA0906_63330 [Streptomyces olivaceus]|nr:hypothetical protein TPA0906_63330 [Streptomyces olivaceus]